MTTPTPDQGASKTEINKRVQARYAALMREGKHGHYETMFRVVHEERATAASEARAAAIAECAQCAETISFDPARRIHPDVPFKDMSEQAQNIAHSTAQTIAADIRALATPAQSQQGKR